MISCKYHKQGTLPFFSLSQGEMGGGSTQLNLYGWALPVLQIFPGGLWLHFIELEYSL